MLYHRRTAITTDGARLDIAANGFWGGRYERTFLDVRVFNPYAPSNRQTTINKCFWKHEMEKMRAYEQRVREIEHAGGLAKQATNFYKRLASKLAEKWDHSYSLTMNWLRCTLSFALQFGVLAPLTAVQSRPAFRPLIWYQPRPTFDLARYRFSRTYLILILFLSYFVQ